MGKGAKAYLAKEFDLAKVLESAETEGSSTKLKKDVAKVKKAQASPSYRCSMKGLL